MSYEDAVEEIVADACEEMLDDSSFAVMMAEEKPELARSIGEWLGRFAAKIKAAVSRDARRHAEAVAMREFADELQDIWDRALVKATLNSEESGVRSENGTPSVTQGVTPPSVREASGTETEQSGTRWSSRENTPLTEDDLTEYLSTGNRKHVRDLKEEQIRKGKSPLLYSPVEIKSFINQSLNGEIRNEVKGYGRIGTNLADDILSEAPDVDVAGYYLELDSNRISHMKDHAEDDTDERNIPLTVNQIENIPYYIDNYDELLDVHKRKDGSVRAYIGKETENGNIVIVELVSRGRKSLQPVTAWQNSREAYEVAWGQKKATNTSHALNNAESGYKVATEKIPQQSGSVKQKNSDRDSGDLQKKYPALDLNEDISQLDGVPAIRLTDGSIIPLPENAETGRRYTHIEFIKANRIDIEDIESGGWIGNGVYDESFQSDTGRYVETEQARKRMAEKRGETYEQFRYSDRDVTDDDTAYETAGRQASYATLRRQNELLRKRVEYWKGQTRTTRAATVREKDVKALAKELLTRFESSADREKITHDLQELGDYIVGNGASGEGMTWEEVYDRCREIAYSILVDTYIPLSDDMAEDRARLNYTKIPQSQRLRDSF
ncbi:MAG: hypothetical protein Q4E35_01275 [Eubacteriales bacterium]|nr:hypothetical protein [Eubacteriales bacterium]